MTIDQLLIKHSFSCILNFINSTFLTHLNGEIKNIFVFLILSLIIFCGILIFTMPLGFLSFFIKEILKRNNDKTVKTMIKNAFINLCNILKNPPPNKFFTNSVIQSFPLITILFFFFMGWEKTLPLIVISIMFNKHVAEKIHFQLNGMPLAIIAIMLYIYFCLIF